MQSLTKMLVVVQWGLISLRERCGEDRHTCGRNKSWEMMEMLVQTHGDLFQLFKTIFMQLWKSVLIGWASNCCCAQGFGHQIQAGGHFSFQWDLEHMTVYEWINMSPPPHQDLCYFCFAMISHIPVQCVQLIFWWQQVYFHFHRPTRHINKFLLVLVCLWNWRGDVDFLTHNCYNL